MGQAQTGGQALTDSWKKLSFADSFELTCESSSYPCCCGGLLRGPFINDIGTKGVGSWSRSSKLHEFITENWEGDNDVLKLC